MIPRKPVVEHPPRIWARQVVLQRRRQVVGIANTERAGERFNVTAVSDGRLDEERAMRVVWDAPEVKVLAHLDLLPHVHEPLLLRRLLDLVVRRDRHDLNLLHMIDVVPAQQCNH
jgi:hypothetical protein